MGGRSTDTVAAPKGARIKISDVADALGISKGTVSRALSDHPDISDRMKLRVREAADRMGYRPLSLAQAIKTGRSQALGLVLQEDEIGGPGPFLAEFLAGISAVASAQHWSLTVSITKTLEGVRETQARLLDERKADGFILPRSRINDPRVEDLREAGVPFVLFGRAADPTGCAWFDIEGEAAIRDAVLRLAGLGHRRIGFMNGGTDYLYASLRAEGYRAGLDAAGLTYDPVLVHGDAVTTEQGEDHAAALFQLPEPPTAIVASVDRAALGIYRAASRFGLAIGSDVSVISYDGVPEGEFANPALTTFSVDRRFAGERLAALLIARIRGEDPETLRELAPATLLERGSHGSPALGPQDLAKRVQHHMTTDPTWRREE